MKIKLDENLPMSLRRDLQRLKYDVDTVHTEGIGGAPDDTVFAAAAPSWSLR